MRGAIGWTATPDDWLVELFAVAPRPWTEKQVYAYLRYVDRAVRRGVGYWTPVDAPKWLAADGQRSRPIGRRGLLVVAGIKDWQGKAWLGMTAAWFDQVPATDAEEAALEAGHPPVPSLNAPRFARGAPVAHPSRARGAPVVNGKGKDEPLSDHPSDARGAPVAHPCDARSRAVTPRASTIHPSQTQEPEHHLAPPVGGRAPPKKATTPGYQEAIALWDEVHADALGQPYTGRWRFGGRDGDPPRVKDWLSTAGVRDGAPDLARLRAAMRAYFAAEVAGEVFPPLRTPSTTRFTRELPEWFGRADGLRVNGHGPRDRPRSLAGQLTDFDDEPPPHRIHIDPLTGARS